MKETVLVVLLIDALATGSTLNYRPCKGTPISCVCKKSTAVCSSLSYVPPIPESVTVLVLENNTFPSIKRQTFYNVSRNKLKELVLKNNSIEHISPDAFEDINTIESLELMLENKISVTNIRDSFLSLNKSNVNKLTFKGNNWLLEQIPVDFLKFLHRGSVEYLTFRGNSFNTFNFGRLMLDYSMKNLDFSDNDLVFLDTFGLQYVTYLNLAVNNIFEIPDFCDNRTGKSLAPQLEVLYISDNAIRKLSSSSFKCLDHLRYLNLDRNRLRVISNNAFLSLPSLSKLSVSFNTQLKVLEDHSFDHPTLHVLLFTHNDFRFDKTTRPSLTKNLLANVPNLHRLDLRNNYLPSAENRLSALFKNLKSIRKLEIPATYLTILPTELFQGMPHLRVLEVGGNRIANWHRGTFENLSSLETLFLDGNYIHVINETSFPPNFLLSLKYVDLSHNNFWCTCQQKWFVDYIRSTNLTKILKNWPKYYTCTYPNDKKNMSLKQYSPTEDDCADWSPIYTIIIVVVTGVFSIFVILMIAFNCIANIRNAIYLFRAYCRKRRGYVRLSCADEYQYDAYVVYCDADRNWVHTVLLKNLETCGLHVCIRLRDFEFGEHIADNIEKYMESSWKVIIVMSNDFTKSEWCQWEMDLVLERRRHRGKRAIVLIMYQQIDSSHMMSSVRSLLDTTPYLQYKEGFGEHLFWSALIQSVKKPFAHPPIVQ